MDIVVTEVRVHSCTVAGVALDITSDVVRVVSLVGVVVLVNIVWELRLVEINFTVLTVPQNHVTKSVLNKETVGLHVVAVDLKAGSNIVAGVFD